MRIRVVGDLHVGSEYGLWPPGVRYRGRAYPQNVGQRWLWRHWLRGWRDLPRPDVVVLNGDLIEGPQPRAGGSGTMSTDLDLQQEALLQALGPIVELNPRPRLYVVEGTAYHEPVRLVPVARLVGASTHHGQLVSADVRLRVYRWRILIGHHPDAGQVMYRGTALERQIVWSLLRSAAEYEHRYDAIVVGHLHTLAYLRVYRTLAVSCPAWCVQDHRSRMRRRHTWMPDVGWVDLLVDTSGVSVVPYEVRVPVPQPEGLQ